MALTAGSRLGPYQITAAIGAGGMGEVYKAQDTRLNRSVAIKVLPDHVAGDPELKQRFEREAKTLAALSHPHICPVFDVGNEGPIDFLVMEYLEGETLEQRLKKGALTLDLALRIAIETADALSTAHRAGVVHRDLKPGNVMLTRSGSKLLDFGLAKATALTFAGSSASILPTTPPVTQQGSILGTFQYMAPEQLEGLEADARTDIFAFGCLLYEMLTGQKAFEQSTQASLIASILEREPKAVTAAQPGASRFVDAIVRKCLAKKPDDRWQSAADLGTALRWAADGGSAETGTPNEAGRRPTARLRSHTFKAAAAAAVILLLAVPFAWRSATRTVDPGATARFEILPPPDTMWTPSPVAGTAQPALSPDGRMLAFVAAPRGGTSQLWIRALDRTLAQPLAGTEGASFPFWSHDGRSLGFFARGKLKRVDVAGGEPQTLCEAVNGRGGSWSQDDVIIFTGSPNSVVTQIPARGGAVTAVSKLDQAQKNFGHQWPQFLPDGRHFLFYKRSDAATTPGEQGVYVGSLDSPAVTLVLAGGSMALYASGYLLFVRDGLLFAQAFDVRALRTIGEPVQIADRIGYFTPAFGYAAVTASSTGVLVHGSPTVALTTQLRWLDRAGAGVGLASVPAMHRGPRLSHDQKSIAVGITHPAGTERDIYLIDVARQMVSRATFDPAADWIPTWSADSTVLFFASNRPGASAIFRRARAGQDEPFYSNVTSGGAFATYPIDASADGQFLLYSESSPQGYDLRLLSLAGALSPTPFLATRFNEVQGRFSANTRFVAYASDESGQFEVYVRPFPARDEQWKVSVAGGTQPEWRRDGRELFYISAERKLMAVPVTTDKGEFDFGAPRALFDVDIPEVSAPYPTEYAVSADGQRFLVNTVVEQTSRPPLTVVLNWHEELRARMRGN